MDFPTSFFWYPLQLLAILILFLVCVIFQGSGFSLPLLFFSTLILVFSSVLLTISSYQVHEHLRCCQRCPPQLQAEPTNPEPETMTQKGGVGHIHGYTLRSLDSVSDLDVGQRQSPDYFSDGSISDEDNFIEIALPSGCYFDHKKQLQKFPEFSPGQMEVFGDMYDEDNLFEIDISMGSIKCC